MAGVKVEMVKVLGLPVPTSAISFSTTKVGDVIIGSGGSGGGGGVNFPGSIVFDTATVSIVGASTEPTGTTFNLGSRVFTVISQISKGLLLVDSTNVYDYEIVGIDLANPRISV